MKKILTIILMIIIVLQISITKVEATQPSSSEIYEGIDVSNWQGNINFEEVARSRNTNCIHKSNSRNKICFSYF